MRLSFFLILSLIAFSSSVIADVLKISDGSRLFGKIIKVEDGTISLKTKYAGTIKVKQSEVLSFETEDPVLANLKGGKTVTGSVESKGDKVRIGEENSLGLVNLSQILSLKPDPGKEPKKDWIFSAGFDLLGKQGNTEEMSLGANALVARKGSRDELKFTAEFEDREKNSEKTADRIAGGASYEYFFKDSLGWYLRTELESDDITSVNLRSTTGAGASYRLLNRDRQTLVARSGLGYRFIDYETMKDDESSLTLDLGLTHNYKFNDMVAIANQLSYVPGIGSSGNNRFVHDSTLIFPIGNGERWSLKLGIKNEYETEPAVSEKLDTTYYSKMSFSWK
jgi:putative salt-induced outer membrane protein YdiY